MYVYIYTNTYIYKQRTTNQKPRTTTNSNQSPTHKRQTPNNKTTTIAATIEHTHISNNTCYLFGLRYVNNITDSMTYYELLVLARSFACMCRGTFVLPEPTQEGINGKGPRRNHWQWQGQYDWYIISDSIPIGYNITNYIHLI